MPTIGVRDTTLYYERTGHGPTLLFVHGMCADANVWAGQVQRLSDRFTCVTYDRRGHTRSGRGGEPESVPTHATDAAALIEALGLRRPVVVGSSGGARIAVEVARTRPGLLAGAVFAEPPIFSLEPEAGQAFLAEIGAAVRPAADAGGPAAAVDAFFPLVCPGLWSQLDQRAKDRYRANGPMMLAEFAGPPYQLSPGDVATITLPSLVLAGTDSHPALRAIAATLSRALPDARFVELDGAGHVTYAERPDGFARAVAAFVTEVTNRTRSAPPHPEATRGAGSALSVGSGFGPQAARSSEA
ncbi:MAG TPA: alpha/beta hydrolase [Amycolatopsis sp.]|nr:alpha/beta hydrolase [Amycolatopsis sp.]